MNGWSGGGEMQIHTFTHAKLEGYPGNGKRVNVGSWSVKYPLKCHLKVDFNQAKGRTI